MVPGGVEPDGSVSRGRLSLSMTPRLSGPSVDVVAQGDDAIIRAQAEYCFEDRVQPPPNSRGCHQWRPVRAHAGPESSHAADGSVPKQVYPMRDYRQSTEPRCDTDFLANPGCGSVGVMPWRHEIWRGLGLVKGRKPPCPRRLFRGRRQLYRHGDVREMANNFVYDGLSDKLDVRMSNSRHESQRESTKVALGCLSSIPSSRTTRRSSPSTYASVCPASAAARP